MERAGAVRPPRAAAPQTSIGTFCPHRCCSWLTMKVQAITFMWQRLAMAWAEATELAWVPVVFAQPPFHLPSSLEPQTKFFTEPCTGAGGERWWTKVRKLSATLVCGCVSSLLLCP